MYVWTRAACGPASRMLGRNYRSTYRQNENFHPIYGEIMALAALNLQKSLFSLDVYDKQWRILVGSIVVTRISANLRQMPVAVTDNNWLRRQIPQRFTSYANIMHPLRCRKQFSE